MNPGNDATNDAYNEGQAFRAMRSAAKLSHEDISRAVATNTGKGVSSSYLSQFENGEVEPTEAWKMKVLAAIYSARSARTTQSAA